MNKSFEVYKYLKDALIAWKPKTSHITVSGAGFNESNVVNIEMDVLPNTSAFDYVFIAPPILNQRGRTTGARGVQQSTQTFVIDVYSRRSGVGVEMKKKTLRAMHENVEFISNLFARQGFLITTPMMDLDYSGNGTIRQVINVTKTFITN